MKINDLRELPIADLLSFLRENGIRSISIGDVSLTLSPKQPAVQWEPSRFEDEGDKQKLSCGHSIWEANNEGECLHGCIPENKKED